MAFVLLVCVFSIKHKELITFLALKLYLVMVTEEISMNKVKQNTLSCQSLFYSLFLRLHS